MFARTSKPHTMSLICISIVPLIIGGTTHAAHPGITSNPLHTLRSLCGSAQTKAVYGLTTAQKTARDAVRRNPCTWITGLAIASYVTSQLGLSALNAVAIPTTTNPTVVMPAVSAPQNVILSTSILAPELARVIQETEEILNPPSEIAARLPRRTKQKRQAELACKKWHYERGMHIGEEWAHKDCQKLPPTTETEKQMQARLRRAGQLGHLVSTAAVQRVITGNEASACYGSSLAEGHNYGYCLAIARLQARGAQCTRYTGTPCNSDQIGTKFKEEL